MIRSDKKKSLLISDYVSWEGIFWAVLTCLINLESLTCLLLANLIDFSLKSTEFTYYSQRQVYQVVEFIIFLTKVTFPWFVQSHLKDLYFNVIWTHLTNLDSLKSLLFANLNDFPLKLLNFTWYSTMWDQYGSLWLQNRRNR